MNFGSINFDALKIDLHSLKCKTFGVEFNNSSWGILRNSRLDVLQSRGVLKIFGNLTGIYLY